MRRSCQQFTIESDILNTNTSFPRGTSGPEKLSRLVEDFNRSVRERTALGISDENGMQMVRIALAMAESARNGKAVRID